MTNGHPAAHRASFLGLLTRVTAERSGEPTNLGEMQMLQWLAEREGSDGRYGATVEAVDATQAKRICAQRGWTFLGELKGVIPADQVTRQQMDDLIVRRNSGVDTDA